MNLASGFGEFLPDSPKPEARVSPLKGGLWGENIVSVASASEMMRPPTSGDDQFLMEVESVAVVLYILVNIE